MECTQLQTEPTKPSLTGSQRLTLECQPRVLHSLWLCNQEKGPLTTCLHEVHIGLTFQSSNVGPS